ncbi:MAG: S8 family serine peptidase [Pseudomonadota bacterium]
MKRFLIVSLLALLPSAGLAQDRFAVSPTGCVDPGGVITVTGSAIPSAARSEVFLERAGRRTEINVTSQQEGRFKAKLPRRGLGDGQTYNVLWAPPGGAFMDVGDVTICKDTKVSGKQPRASKEVVPAPSGAPEYIVVVPNGQLVAATNAVEGIGATILRTRSLAQFGQTILMVELSGGAGLQDLRDALAGPAPDADADFHHIYGLSEGARLYAATLVGASTGGCNVPRGTRIGLIDSGVNASHPALNGVPVRSYNALSQGEKRLSPDHGTAVAALVAGSGAEVFGFAQGASIFAAEAFGAAKSRTGARLENIAASLDWMTGQGVRYVNMSMSGPPNRAFDGLLRSSARKGALLVAAAGNEGTNSVRFPAGSNYTVAVTAVDAKGRSYRKANSGKHIDVAAPGVDLYVAGSSGAGYKSGTSYAAPIALARLAQAGVRSKDQATRFISKNAADLGPSGRDAKYGYGLIKFSNCF